MCCYFENYYLGQQGFLWVPFGRKLIDIYFLFVWKSDDNVEVGADLYQIDTEGVATAVTTAVADNESSTKEEISNTTEVSSTIEEVVSKSDESVRNPSIHFLGKEGWKDKLTVVAKSLPQIAQPLKPNGAITLDGGHLTPMYGRLPFSEREMEALMMGGASEAPFDQM